MDIHWRNTQKPVRFLFLDARAFLGIILFLVHARTWVLVLVCFYIFMFWIFEKRGLSFESAVRAIRCWLLGRNRPANSRLAIRRMIDFS